MHTTSGRPDPAPYISQINWLVSRGREDLIDVIADEYEFHRTRWESDQAGDYPPAGAYRQAQPEQDRQGTVTATSNAR